MKIQRNRVTMDDVDAKFPLYSEVEEGDGVWVYTKIEKDSFTKIVMNRTTIELTKFKQKDIIVSELYFNNQCTKEEWDEQVVAVKLFLANF